MKKWFDLGIELGLPKSDLQHIKLKNREDLKECLKKMLTTWLKLDAMRKRENITWATLVEALKSEIVNEKDIADKIAKKYKATKYPQHTTIGHEPSATVQTIIVSERLFCIFVFQLCYIVSVLYRSHLPKTVVLILLPAI